MINKVDIDEALEKMKKNEENLIFKKDRMNFGGKFQELIEILEIQHALTASIEKKDEENPYRIKKVILVFENKKSDQKKTTISQEE